MSERQTDAEAAAPEVTHSTFAIERAYPAPLERVFSAFSDEATKRRWFAEGEGWHIDRFELDFRVGGTETSRFRFGDGPEITNDTLFHDIVENRRIVYSYRMTVAGKPISVSLATVQLEPSGAGTVMTYTEQGAYFDDACAGANREEGSRLLMEALAAELERQ